MTRYVYVAEQGAYSDRGIVGVYASPEAAMAAHPVPADYQYPEVPSAHNASRRGGWQPCSHAEPGFQWSNGLDWGDGVVITRYAVEGEEPESPIRENAPDYADRPSSSIDFGPFKPSGKA